LTNGQKIQKEKAKFHVLFNDLRTSSMLGVYNSHPPLSSSCCSEPQFTFIQLSPFYHLSTLDVTHVRKDLCILRATKNGEPGNKAID